MKSKIVKLNQIFSTNVQRIVSGVVNNTAKSDEASFTVKYTGLPVNYDTPLHILETDYDSYAVIWSCNPLVGAIGHTGKRRKIIISIEKKIKILLISLFWFD